MDYCLEPINDFFLNQYSIIFRIYSLCGDLVTSMCKFKADTGFVLVRQCDKFKEADYEKAFEKLISSQPIGCKMKSKSTPVIPLKRCMKSEDSIIKCTPKSNRLSSICETSEESESESSSDDECPCEPKKKYQPKPAAKKCPYKPPRVATPMPKKPKKKKGFFASCFPCCVKRVGTAVRPVTMGKSGNSKITQTTKEDFKCSIKVLNNAKKNERKRKQSYKSSGRYRKGDGKGEPMYCPKDLDSAECEDPKKIQKFEQAREKFFQRRLKMESQIAKSLEKQLKNDIRCDKKDEVADNSDSDDCD